MCQGSEVVVVGGGNSAGQAAVFLATQVRKVYLVIRGDDLNKDMSAYLARRVEEHPRIEVLRNTEVRGMSGEGHLGEVELVNNKSGEVRRLRTPALFSFIGAAPRTDWLPPEIERDAKGFVRTGPALARSPHWTRRRAAVPAGGQPPRRIRRGGRAVRLGQAGRFRGRRGGDGGAVRPRVSEGGEPRRAPRGRHPGATAERLMAEVGRTSETGLARPDHRGQRGGFVDPTRKGMDDGDRGHGWSGGRLRDRPGDGGSGVGRRIHRRRRRFPDPGPRPVARGQAG